ncbi:YveK family protein [Fervidicella metallireducens]|uniref:YveK family protein n=1 Tax=Fervidicella metallireducens TaxID=655338 RepID=UPI0031014B19
MNLEQEMTLDLHDIFEAIRKRLWIIISITIACVVLSGVLSFFVIKPTYEAKVSIIIGKPPATEEGSKVDYNDVMMYQKLVKTYSQIAKSRSVAEKTLTKLGSTITPEDFLKKITVTPQLIHR